MEATGKQQKKAKKNYGYDSSDEEEKQPQKPIGYQYQDNFPSLPDQDGYGKKIRDADERRKKLATKQAGGINSHAFETNFAHEISTLNTVKTKFKLISNVVI